MWFPILFLLLTHLTITTLATTKPNIVFILTDDQDAQLDSLSYMPYVKKYIADEGIHFKKHYCTVAICCPSRVNLWTGRAAHNTNVTDVFPPYGGYPKFISQGFNTNYLPIWLQAANYSTYYTGKLFNSQTITNYASPPAGGFTGSDFLLDPYTYQSYAARMTRNAAPPIDYTGLYSGDLIANKTYAWIDDAVEAGTPFFVVAAPIAPHSEVGFTLKGFQKPKYAARHEGLFKDIEVPRGGNFNGDEPSGASWVKRLPKLTDENIAYNDEWYRSRLRALQSVDEMVHGIIQKLESYNILDNTYIIYTSDNGYHISNHRMQPGKTCGYEEDINIPLLIRGPGVPKGVVSEKVNSHTDLAPTILGMAGVTDLSGFEFDGRVIDLNDGEEKEGEGEHVTVEFWGLGIPEGDFGLTQMDRGNNTYKALRVIGEGYNLYYSVWCTNEHELYDMGTDPHQLHNLIPIPFNQTTDILSRPLSRLLPRLDALLLVLKSCKEETCRYPWKSLHPLGDVKSLKQALEKRFDTFYDRQPRVSFSSCELGYLVGAEGPQVAGVYEGVVGGGRAGSQKVLGREGEEEGEYGFYGRMGWSDWT